MSAVRRAVSALVLALALASLAPRLAAQTSSQAQTGTAVVDTTQQAQEVRRQLTAVMKKYPPALGRILKLDPGLFHNNPYMAPYPALKAFVGQHPEIPRNPEYYLQEFDSYSYNNRTPGQAMFEDILTGVMIFAMTAVILGGFIWMVRTLVDYRRWHRLSRVQAETHTKLLDRFTANDDLLAYVQSPAGSRFLQSAPIALDPGSRAVSAPFGRILLSAQAGVVLAAAGLGLYYVSGKVDPEMVQAIYTLGVFTLFVGVGFIASAALSYVLSKRLGLFNPPPAPPTFGGRQDT